MLSAICLHWSSPTLLPLSFFVLEGGDGGNGDLEFFCQPNWAALKGVFIIGFLGVPGRVKQMQPKLWPFVQSIVLAI